jgi:hypothetical protein
MTENKLILPSQNVINIDGVIFSSDFDNGNLLKVEKNKSSSAYDYKIWTAADNQGIMIGFICTCVFIFT